jgi:beta-RFAP synthase
MNPICSQLPGKSNYRSLVPDCINEKPGPASNIGGQSLNTGLNSVVVTAPARLHLGFLDLNGELGRSFGSMGLAISGFRTRIRVSKATTPYVSGPDSERARRYLERLQVLLSLDEAHRVEIAEAIPDHSGLGSGTQLALALAAAIRRLHHMPLDVGGDAFRLGRGRRSGVGIGLFNSGGVVVDGGCKDPSRAAPIVSRIPFPDEWRIVLVLDRKRTGVHGEEESAAFARLPSFAATDAAHICRLVLMQALPALVEADLTSFAAAIKEMQTILGAYFAPLQGGHSFASREVAAAMEVLEGEGAVGIGQSSWGPTAFAFARSRNEARRLIDVARNDPRCRAVDIQACMGINRGAEIEADAVVALPNP